MSDNADHDTYADLDMQHEPDEAMTYPCPICEHWQNKSVCSGPCKGTGQVADRRQSQRRQGAGRRQGDDQLVRLLRERKLSASTMRHRLKLAADYIAGEGGGEDQ